MLTDNEVVQDAAIMKDQLSLPVMSESPLDTTKKTSSQKLLDEQLEDLPIEHYEHDEIKGGQPITDSPLSTNICERDTEGVSARSELGSTDSESEGEKLKGKTCFQKFETG